MKKILIIVVILLVAGGAFYYVRTHKSAPASTTNDNVPTKTTSTNPSASGPDYKNMTYTIDDMPIKLVKGSATTDSVPGSAIKIETDYFGNEAKGDLNGDGKDDVAFLVTQDAGGTGVFCYVLVALSTPAGYVGSNGIILGDRIAPQTTEIKNGQLIVNYADRKPDQAMSDAPTVGVSKYIKVTKGVLTEVTSE